MYASLEAHPALIPPAFAVSLPRMIADDWLVGYQTVEGVSRALFILGRRIRGAPRLEKALPLLSTHCDELAIHFATFFPELLELKN